MKKNAFTLIEIMVVVAIVSVVSAGILTVVIRSLHAYYTVSALNEINNNASFAIDEIIKDVRQSNIDMSLTDQIQDPITGQLRDILVLSFTNSPDAATGNPLWQGVIVYYPFMTLDNINQMRKYVYNGPVLAADFPLTASVTANSINIFRNNATLLVTFNRTGGHEKVLANFISTAGPAGASTFIDNGDGTISVILFLQKPVTGISGGANRQVSLALNSNIILRN